MNQPQGNGNQKSYIGTYLPMARVEETYFWRVTYFQASCFSPHLSLRSPMGRVRAGYGLHLCPCQEAWVWERARPDTKAQKRQLQRFLFPLSMPVDPSTCISFHHQKASWKQPAQSLVSCNCVLEEKKIPRNPRWGDNSSGVYRLLKDSEYFVGLGAGFPSSKSQKAFVLTPFFLLSLLPSFFISYRIIYVIQQQLIEHLLCNQALV